LPTSGVGKAGFLLQEFRSDRIVIVTHRSANEKEREGHLSFPGLPDLLF